MSDEVVRGLAGREPARDDRRLAAARAAGQRDPAIDALVDQDPVERRERKLATDEALIELPAELVQTHTPHPFAQV
jgi:hypothetical protein